MIQHNMQTLKVRKTSFLGGYSWKDDWNTLSCVIRAKSCEFTSVTHARVPR